MKAEFLKQEGNDRLILIFGGWSTDSSFYSHIDRDNWDILVASGYSDFSFPLEILNDYKTIVLFAWSMGVYAASSVIPGDKIALAIALNGTENPVSDTEGIPEAIFSGTLQTLSERNLMKFRKRMCGSDFNNLKDSFTVNDIETLKGELSFIQKHNSYKHSSTDKNSGNPLAGNPINWNRVFIASGDYIFPPQNQLNAWKNHPAKPEIIEIDFPHYVNLSKIVNSTIHSIDKISSRFREALPTYDNQATAQKQIVETLMDYCPSRKLNHVVEIGPGSGLLTSRLVEKVDPEILELVELYPLPDFAFDCKTIQHIADAEIWIEEAAKVRPKSVSGIFSSSVIQWFTDTEAFFKNASILLEEKGLLLCSTFLPGNLHELLSVNPFPLPYRKRDEIERFLKRYFKEVRLHEETIQLTFKSQRELLLHLRRTGVGGSFSSKQNLIEITKRLPLTLTYRPLFIIASK